MEEWRTGERRNRRNGGKTELECWRALEWSSNNRPTVEPSNQRTELRARVLSAPRDDSSSAEPSTSTLSTLPVQPSNNDRRPSPPAPHAPPPRYISRLMSRTYLALLHYDGRDFVGWQRQPSGRTVQAEVERVLERLCERRIVAHAAGRTDAGVHAVGMGVSFTPPAGNWTMTDSAEPSTDCCRGTAGLSQCRKCSPAFMPARAPWADATATTWALTMPPPRLSDGPTNGPSADRSTSPPCSRPRR